MVRIPAERPEITSFDLGERSRSPWFGIWDVDDDNDDEVASGRGKVSVPIVFEAKTKSRKKKDSEYIQN